MIVCHFEKLSHSQAVAHAAATAMLALSRSYGIRYGWGYKEPVVAVMDGDACRAFIQYQLDDDDLRININLAWCDPEHPGALAMAAAGFRAKLPDIAGDRVEFVHHAGNTQMARLAKLLCARGGRMISVAYEIPVAALQKKARD